MNAPISPFGRAWRRFSRRTPTRIALVYLVGVVLVALFAPWLPLASPSAIHTEWATTPPAGAEFAAVEDSENLSGVRTLIFGDTVIPPYLGRDALGRDLLARIVWGARISLLTAVAAALVSLLIGVTWGAVAGACGGWTDDVMMRIVDLLYSLPFIFVVIFLVSTARGSGWFTGPVANLAVFLITLGLVYWLTMARVVHGQVITLKKREFVEGARALGAGGGRILVAHLLPNLAPIMIVTLTLTIPRILLIEAFLSFLGLGVQAPHVSWGTLSRDAFEVLTPIHTPWWLVLFPSLAIVTTLGALQHLGDALRDAWSPREGH